MKPWHKGDPVGVGVVYLPDINTKQEYTKACKGQMIESDAQHVLGLPSLEQRRKFINSYPPQAQKQLKDMVSELWETQRPQSQDLDD